MSRKKSKPNKPVAPAFSRKKIWWFRLVALLGAPLVLIGMLEIGLRVAGFGHPTAFLLPALNHGQKVYVQNNQFGWRFFGPRMARLPNPISIPQEKAPGVIRVFVFGESAAFGDPQPRFGLPRMLQAMLELRHPGLKFEVVNAAMTGINSHTIVPIARDCARADGDVWVVYMGNNEVVGPFGAGTVFGPQAPALPAIRASLALKTTRIGQLLDSLLDTLRPPPPAKSEWGGMMMFLDQRIRADDPRMTNVYRNFDRNLTDIIRAGRASHAKIVVSTVAVNLRDCAPFASLHWAGLSAAQLQDWETDFNRGVAAQRQKEFSVAQSSFRAAAAIDNTFAELRFRMGQCALALGDSDEARKQFAAARDLDALRFRCDSRLNELIRQVVAGSGGGDVKLADAEQEFASASPAGLPGAELFYEHVHLTFEGNYILARTIAAQVEKLLGPKLTSMDRPWPEIAECARRLGRTDRAGQLALSEILGRLADPPFTWQLNHVEEQQRLAGQSRKLGATDSPASLQAARASCEAAIVAFPDDAWLLQQLAELKQAGADYAGAAAAVRQSLDLLASNSEGWLLLGSALAHEQKYEEAAAAFRQVFALDPQDVWGRQNFAICLQKLGRRDEAIREFRLALSIKPRFGLAWLGLGQVYEEAGRSKDAAACYEKALANPVHRSDELITLARFCQSRKWLEAACTNYAEAIQLNPSDAGLRMEAGQVLVSLNRHAEAAQRFAEARQLSPGLGQAYFLCGLELGRLGKPAEAEKEFREAARLMPDLAEAWVNLGLSLYQQKKFEKSLAMFEKALEQDPANMAAAKYVNLLRQRAATPP